MCWVYSLLIASCCTSQIVLFYCPLFTIDVTIQSDGYMYTFTLKTCLAWTVIRIAAHGGGHRLA